MVSLHSSAGAENPALIMQDWLEDFISNTFTIKKVYCLKMTINKSCRSSIYIMFTIVQFAVLCSCKKDHKIVCRLTEIIGLSGANQSTTSIQYNSDRTIRSMTGSGTYPASAFFMYNNNTVIIHRFTGISNTFRETDSVTLNSSGFVSNIRDFLKEDKSTWLNWKYEFNTPTEINKFLLSSSEYSRVTEGVYTYRNGNIIQREDTRFEYDTTKPSKPGDFHNFNLLLTYGQNYMQSKNLVTSQINNTDTTFYKYFYDSEGKISEMDFVHKGIITNQYKYTYACD